MGVKHDNNRLLREIRDEVVRIRRALELIPAVEQAKADRLAMLIEDEDARIAANPERFVGHETRTMERPWHRNDPPLDWRGH